LKQRARFAISNVFGADIDQSMNFYIAVAMVSFTSVWVPHDQFPTAIGLTSQDFDGFGVNGNRLPGIILSCAFKNGVWLSDLAVPPPMRAKSAR
jgi:hypothetical protein